MIIGCCGLQGSASTWTYNVVQEIMRRSGKSLSSGSIENLPALTSLNLSKVDTLVIKAHCMHHQIVDILNLSRSPIIVSYRDPVECAVSLHSRILEDQNDSIKNVVRSFASVASIVSYCDCFRLDFEEDFTAKLDTVFQIAKYINEKISEITAKSIFDQFEKQKLTEYFVAARDKKELSSNGFYFDPATLFNENHITHERKLFSPAHDEELKRIFGGVQRGRLRLAPGDFMIFSEQVFCFDGPWPRREGPGVKILNGVYLPRGLWSLRISGRIDEAKISDIFVCQSGQVIMQFAIVDKNEVDIDFIFENLFFDDDLQVFVEGGLPESFETDREDSFRLEARLIALVTKSLPS